jgi:prephenate dehydrogenase
MDFNRIAIIGIGLMGGSFALALKEHGYKGKIIGIGRRPINLRKAKKLGIIDEYTTDPKSGVRSADLVILCTPVGQFEGIINNIKNDLKEGTIVSDLGSVKARLVKMLHSKMPSGVHFVGAHPIAGRECSGLNGARHDLFVGAKCIITPVDGTNPRAVAVVKRIWKSIGAIPIIMSPEEHDMVYAAVSHLPHVVAYSLVNTITDLRYDILKFSGKGFRDMTRIALSPTEIWRDICIFNRKEILKMLRRFSSSISKITRLIEAKQWERLEQEFIKAKHSRELIE